MQTFDALHIGQTVREVVERDLQAEMEARALYEEARPTVTQSRIT